MNEPLLVMHQNETVPRGNAVLIIKDFNLRDIFNSGVMSGASVVSPGKCTKKPPIKMFI